MSLALTHSICQPIKIYRAPLQDPCSEALRIIVLFQSSIIGKPRYALYTGAPRHLREQSVNYISFVDK